MKEMSNELVSIIIVTAGRGDYLKPCIESVITQTYSDIEIIIIDNSFDCNLVQEICKCYPDIKLHFNRKNLFYCQALNIGLEMSRGEFALCLNDDVILERNFIEEALKGFSIDKRIGMVSGKILRRGRNTLDSTGLFLSYARCTKERGYGKVDKGQFENDEYIFGVNGAVSFYRKEMLDNIKENNEYFDSDFHIFYEDLDIAWRANRKDWKGYYIPRAVAYHTRGGTVRSADGMDKPFARKYLSDELHVDLIKNRYLAMIKNENFYDFLIHLPGTILYDLALWTYILIFKPKLIKKFLLCTKYLKKALEERRILNF
jgi:GT2 family glycosyltransferase